ncbi:unnamed protein product, partial [Brassica oleracea]
IRTPLAFIGRIVTYWPNLLTANGGFFNLILNLLTGKLVEPDESDSPPEADFTNYSLPSLETKR